MTNSLPPLPSQFSAELVRSDGDRSKVYVDGWMRRVEFYFKTGQSSLVISRPDKGIAWTLNPQDRTYYQTKLPKKMLDRVLDPDSLCDWKADGTQSIDGRECIRFVGRYREFVGEVGEAHEVRYVDAESRMRRRIVTFNKFGHQALTADYLNVVLRPPDPAVFEIPKGYTKVKL